MSSPRYRGDACVDTSGQKVTLNCYLIVLSVHIFLHLIAVFVQYIVPTVVPVAVCYMLAVYVGKKIGKNAKRYIEEKY